jgi:hypothetical protein
MEEVAVGQMALVVLVVLVAGVMVGAARMGVMAAIPLRRRGAIPLALPQERES